MKSTRKTLPAAEELRMKAELKIASQLAEPQSTNCEFVNSRELHELQVYKIELEMQNDELRLALEELREHEEHLSNIINNNPAGYFHLDPQGRFIEVNDAWLRMHGYDSADEVIGKHFSMMQVDSDLVATLKHVAELLKGAPVPIGEYSALHKDGSIAYHTFSAHPVVHANNVVGLEWFIIDTTERKLAEKERILSESRLTSLIDIAQYLFTNEQDFFDHALDEIIKFTSSKIGYIYFYSEQKRQFTLNSWSTEVMKECSVVEQQTIYDLDSTGIWGEAVRQRKPILINDFQAENPLKIGIPEGHVTLNRFLTVPVIIDGVIVAVVGVANKESDYIDSETKQLIVFMDAVWKIAAHKRADAEKINLLTQLHQAQKMESVGRLAGGVAHDFNNMLGVIIGHTEMALMHMEPNHPIYSSLIETQKAANRSADLTRQLLAFARKQVVEPNVIDLNETVDGMLKMLQRLIGENINLTWRAGESLYPVMMDTSQVDQIMANLCVNARDSIENVGEIIIETGNCTFTELQCKANTYYLPGDFVKIAVSDDGKGMDAETLNHIFEPFFTTKGVGEGTGLGLATVYGIVKQNNGFINVYSEPGTGTTFSIYMPRYKGSAEKSEVIIQKVITHRGHETVLLVEDEPAILEMTTSLLKELGYTVLKASDPGEAIRLARENSGEINLLITDVIMPKMNGGELAKKMLSLYPQMKCLFMSGYTADIISHHGVLDKGENFIQKPFQLNIFAAKLREVLDN